MQNLNPTTAPTAPADALLHAQREQLSALMDGECSPDEVQAVASAYGQSAALQQAWADYQWLGEVLRAPAGGPRSADTAFVGAVMARIRQEGASGSAPALAEVKSVVVAPLPNSANDAVFRWKMVAGVAALCAVAAVAWQVVVSPAASSGPQLALNAPSAPTQVVMTEHGAVVRDAQLEALLAAHRQYGGMSALQMPAGFLRNASYEPAAR